MLSGHESQCLRAHNHSLAIIASFSHDMQGVGDFFGSECVNRPQGRRFERLQCSLHDPAGPTVAAALQEPVKQE